MLAQLAVGEECSIWVFLSHMKKMVHWIWEWVQIISFVQWTYKPQCIPFSLLGSDRRHNKIFPPKNKSLPPFSRNYNQISGGQSSPHSCNLEEWISLFVLGPDDQLSTNVLVWGPWSHCSCNLICLCVNGSVHNHQFHVCGRALATFCSACFLMVVMAPLLPSWSGPVLLDIWSYINLEK